MLTRKQAATELLTRRRARGAFRDYVTYTNPKYKESFFSEVVCAALDQFIADMQSGKRPILVFQAPPQHGKSELVSRKLPAYIMGRFPDWRIAAASYANTLAGAMSLDVRRNLVEPAHLRLFPVPLEKARYSVNRNGEFSSPYGRGGYIGDGVGGGFTGRPVDCVVAGTLIDTDIGRIPIENLAAVWQSRKVLAYCDGALSYERILAFRASAGCGIWRVTSAHGRSVETTGDHRYYTSGGYVVARELTVGDELLASNGSTDRVVRVERVREEAAVFDIQVEKASNFFANGVLVHNCFIVDDPTKNAQEALSPTTKESVWNWYQTVCTTRLSENSGQIIMATSWAEDDLPGRIISQYQGDPRLTVLRFPAINEPGEAGYNPLLPEGALVPELHSLKKLKETKGLFSDYWWSAIYQQSPKALGGNVFKEDGIRYYLPKDLPAKFDKVIASWDCTFKDTDGTDFVVGQVWGKAGANSYLLAQVRQRMSFTKTVAAVVKLRNDWPKTREVLIEDKANGPAVIDTLKASVPGIIPIEPDGSKLARAHAVTSYWEAGNVWLPHPDIAPWIKDLVSELTAFPAAANDDQVDALTQALRRLYPLFHKLKISQEALNKAMGYTPR